MCVCPLSVALCLPVVASHNTIMSSPVPAARVLPSGEYLTHLIESARPLSVSLASPVLASHSRTVPSVLPLATMAPSAEYAILLTASVCPESVAVGYPPIASHKTTVLSILPLAIAPPSGAYATHLTYSLCSTRRLSQVHSPHHKPKPRCRRRLRVVCHPVKMLYLQLSFLGRDVL